MAPCWLIGTKSSFCRSRADEWRDYDSGENGAGRRLEPGVIVGELAGVRKPGGDHRSAIFVGSEKIYATSLGFL
jgi:hypothetical protein